MKARLLLKDKRVFADGTVVEQVVWRLPEATPERPHGLKYSLYCGKGGARWVGYDNEQGKGDHRHYGAVELPYRFISLERLLADFAADIQQYLGVDHDE